MRHQGEVDAVRVATWPGNVGLTAWRVDLAGSSPTSRSMAFSLYFEDQLASAVKSPKSLSTIVLSPEIHPVFMRPTGLTKLSIGDASSFETFVPYWRWLLHRLGLADRDTTPLRGLGSGINEAFDPWVGHLTGPFDELLVKAEELDRRLEEVVAEVGCLVRREEERGASHGSIYSMRPYFFERASKKADPGLVDDLLSFVEGGQSYGTMGLIAGGAYLNRTAAHEACFAANGEMRFELMRPTRTGSVTYCDQWSGHHVSALVRWLSDLSMHLSWAVLDNAKWEEWYVNNALPAELALPAEEVELYEMIGESIPFSWQNKPLQEWAMERFQ